jgi:molybdopterin-guanine dinucleotide biosynthesis protein A
MLRDGKPGLADSVHCVAASTPLRSARNDVSAVLLAGGESRRMGTDKATFLFRGKPLWQVQLETLQKLRPKEIFVSARIDPPWRRDDVVFVADIPPSRGPLSGLAASLNRMSTSHLLALAIDMPWMSNRYLEFLCAQIEPGRGVLPKIGDRAEPLAAIYPRKALGEFRDALMGTDFSLQTLIRHQVESGKLHEIPVTDRERRFFLNVNEVSDLPEL